MAALGMLCARLPAAAAATAGGPRAAFVAVTGSPYAAGQGADAVAFSPDGDLLAVADYNLNAVSMFAVGADGRLRRVAGSPFPTGAGPVALAFSPSGDTLAVADYGQSAVSLDAVTAGGQLLARHGSPLVLQGAPYAVAYSPNGRLLAAADAGADEIQLFDTAATGVVTGALMSQPLSSGADPTSLQFSPGSDLLAVAEHGSDAVATFTVGLAGTNTAGALTPLLNSPLSTSQAPDTVSFNREGTLLAASDYNANQVDLLDVSASAGLSTDSASPIDTDAGSGPDSAVFSPTTDVLAVALGTANTTALYSTGTAQTPSPLSGSPVAVGTGPAGVAFNGQGTLMATANIYSNSVSVAMSTAPPPAVVSLPTTSATIARGHISVRVRCAAIVDGGAGHRCAGRLTLTRGDARVGARRFVIAAGRTAAVTLTLSRALVQLAAHGRRIRLTARASARGASTAQTILTASA